MAGRRIDDHSSWMGKGGEYPLPMGSKMKKVESHTEDASDIRSYDDTNEEVVKTQRGGTAKIRSKPMKDGYRN